MSTAGKRVWKAALVGIALLLGACAGTTVSPTQDALALSAASYSIAQSAGSVSVTVERTGPTAKSVSVDFATADGTALAGTDYTAASGTLQWAENDGTPKTITVAISNATPSDSTKTFSIALSNPSVSAQLASPSTATVSITGSALTSPGSIVLSSATYTVVQGAGMLTVTANRTGGSAGAVSAAYATSDGTAVAGTDYSAASGTLNWSDGDGASKSFTVAISGATPFVGSKTFNVTLSNASGGATIGTPGTATVTIAGDGSALPGSLQFSTASYQVGQGAGTVVVTVDRVGGTNGAVAVNYATVNGTAVAGTDFTAASGTLQWANGDATAKTFSVAISNAAPFVGGKTFTVQLSSPAGTTITNPGSATVSIAGDGSAPVGNLQFSAASYAVGQGAGTLTLSVDRVSGSSGAISVAYAAQNGSAVSGTDFTLAAGTLNWATGDSAAKTISVTISNATPFSGSKSFNVVLSKPTGGATLSSPSTAAVVITGDAVSSPGALQFATATYTTSQSAGTISVTVNRSGGSTGAASVAYATAGGTAVAGTDFTATSGTLNWAAGDASSKLITVPISAATPFQGTKSFTIALSGATGASLGTPASATVTISGSVAGSAPTAPTNFVLTNEGANSETMSWTASAPGPAPISYYKIYRNGVAYATTTATTYTDNAATNATITNFAAPATIYSYTVAAVDTAGNEGPQATDMTFWVYHDGTYFWQGDFSAVTLNYKDTTGVPESGAYDISVTSNVTNGYAQPYSGGLASPLYAADIGAFKYMIIDLKPTVANQVWRLNIISRLPQGDVFNNAPVYLPGTYGPAPVVGKWATYKIPLNPDMAVGTGSFVGSISGNTLTVTAVNAGMSVQTTAWISGPGIPPNTCINSFGTGNGGTGTYILNNSATVPAGTTINMQRTEMYKFSVIDETNSTSNVYYMDNIGFTTQ